MPGPSMTGYYYILGSSSFDRASREIESVCLAASALKPVIAST